MSCVVYSFRGLEQLRMCRWGAGHAVRHYCSITNRLRLSQYLMNLLEFIYLTYLGYLEYDRVIIAPFTPSCNIQFVKILSLPNRLVGPTGWPESRFWRPGRARSARIHQAALAAPSDEANLHCRASISERREPRHKSPQNQPSQKPPGKRRTVKGHDFSRGEKKRRASALPAFGRPRATPWHAPATEHPALPPKSPRTQKLQNKPRTPNARRPGSPHSKQHHPHRFKHQHD
jgi:hypothetical protein